MLKIDAIFMHFLWLQALAVKQYFHVIKNSDLEINDNCQEKCNNINESFWNQEMACIFLALFSAHITYFRHFLQLAFELSLRIS